LGSIVAAVLLIGRLRALAASLTEGVSWALDRLGFAAALLGAAADRCDRIGGFTTKAIAGAFANSPASDKAWVRIVGHAVEMHTGLFFIWLPLFFRVPLMLLGFAIPKSAEYSARLGWFGITSGTASTLTGMAKFLKEFPHSTLSLKPALLPGRFRSS
jgi:hypothetical protein